MELVRIDMTGEIDGTENTGSNRRAHNYYLMRGERASSGGSALYGPLLLSLALGWYCKFGDFLALLHFETQRRNK